MRKKFLTTALSLLLMAAVIPSVIAQSGVPLSVDMSANVRTNARHHRGLVPLASVVITAQEPISKDATFSILLDANMPALFSSDFSQLFINGPAGGKIKPFHEDMLSANQKEIMLTAEANLIKGDEVRISGLFLKVFTLDNQRWPVYVRLDGAETNAASASASTIHLDRSEGPKRNMEPEPIHGLSITQSSLEEVRVNWYPNPEPDFREYHLAILQNGDVTPIKVLFLQDQQANEQLFSGLKTDLIYTLVFEVMDLEGFVSEVRKAFKLSKTFESEAEAMPASESEKFFNIRNEGVDFEEIYQALGSDELLDGDAEFSATELFRILERASFAETLSEKTMQRSELMKKRLLRLYPEAGMTQQDLIRLLLVVIRSENLKKAIGLQIPQTSNMPAEERATSLRLYRLMRIGLFTEPLRGFDSGATLVRGEDAYRALYQLLSRLKLAR